MIEIYNDVVVFGKKEIPETVLKEYNQINPLTPFVIVDGKIKNLRNDLINLSAEDILSFWNIAQINDLYFIILWSEDDLGYGYKVYYPNKECCEFKFTWMIPEKTENDIIDFLGLTPMYK
jgi:hypothetical protein